MNDVRLRPNRGGASGVAREIPQTALLRYVLILVAAFVASACTTPDGRTYVGVYGSPIKINEQQNTSLEVLVVTNRDVVANPPGSDSTRATRAKVITVGACDVTVPKVHKMGVLESPSTWHWQNPSTWFWQKEKFDEDKHFVFHRFNALSGVDFLSSRMETRARSDRPRRTLVYVPGHDTSLEDACRQGAQLRVDMGPDVQIVIFSFPVGVGVTGYPQSVQNAEWAAPALGWLLQELCRRPDRGSVSLLAHSVGALSSSRAIVDWLPGGFDSCLA
jgi:esterase/lipase superfamily enzyme